MKLTLKTLTAIVLVYTGTSADVSAQFTFTGTGNYTDEVRWSPSYPGTMAPSAATFINGNCTVTDDLLFASGLTISSGGTLTQGDGSTVIWAYADNITIDGAVVLKVTDGVLRVSQSAQLVINGDVSGVGLIRSDLPILGTGSLSPGDPGSPKGALWMGVTCDLRNKTLNIQLFGNGDNDVLNLRDVPGESFLDGTLNVTLEGGYVPEIGHSFVIINATPDEENTTDFTGKSFSAVNLPTLPANRLWALTYSAGGVVLSVEDAGLPVTLSSFDGYPEGGSNVLKWSTANETENSHFEIERSDDGTQFKVIGRVNGAGSTTLSRTYTFIDQAFQNELSYYRLRQVDLGGSSEYSNTILVKNSPQLTGSRLYPNPVSGRGCTVCGFAFCPPGLYHFGHQRTNRALGIMGKQEDNINDPAKSGDLFSAFRTTLFPFR